MGSATTSQYGCEQVAASKEGLALAAGQPPETNGGLQHAVDERCLVEIRKI